MVKLNRVKYPTLPEEKDLRRKLMQKDIKEIQGDYKKYSPFPSKSEVMKRRSNGEEVMSESQWISGMSDTYGVSNHTIYYYIHDDYRKYKKLVNAQAHSKSKDLEDYEKHRNKENNRRVDRWNRHPKLREWHYIISAKNEKRGKRKTVLGKPI